MEERAALSHQQAQEWVHHVLDGALAVEHHVRLDEHLAVCPACRTYAARVQSLDRQLARAVPMLGVSFSRVESRRGADLRAGLARRSRQRLFATMATGLIGLAMLIGIALGRLSLGEVYPSSESTPIVLTATHISSDVQGQLIFEEWRTDGVQIYRINPDGSGQERLIDLPGNTMLPRLSPDGQRLAMMYAHNESVQLALVDLANGSLQTLIEGQKGDPGWVDIVWSPDGQALAVVRAFKSISGGGQAGSSYSIDGTNEGSLTIQRLDGSSTIPIADHLHLTWSPQWSPDGQRIFFNAAEYGFGRIYSARPDGSDLHMVGNSSGTVEQGAFALSPDGKQIAYFLISRPRGSPRVDTLVLSNLDGSNARVIKSFESGMIETDRLVRFGYLSFSPDGSQVLYIPPDARSMLKLHDLTTGEETTLFTDINLGLSGKRPVWSPDGRYIALATAKQIYIFSARVPLPENAPQLVNVYETTGIGVGSIQWINRAAKQENEPLR